MDWLQSLFSLPQDASFFVVALALIKRMIATTGVLVILCGAIAALYNFMLQLRSSKNSHAIDRIRLEFGRIIILGLEFIVAADVIETTTAPDYYSVGILAVLVGIRTFLTFFMNRELQALSKRT